MTTPSWRGYNLPIKPSADVDTKNLQSEVTRLRNRAFEADRAITITRNAIDVRVPLSSSNYVPNASGWRFDLNGDAELNSVTIRGTLAAADGFFSGTLGATTVAAINIDADQISAGFLSVDRLQVNSINGNRITDGTISGGKIQDLAITANQIANLTIDASKIMNLQINSDKIGNAAVNDSKVFPNINGNKVTAGTISGISGSFVSLTSVGITVNVSPGTFNAGLSSTTGAFSSSISNSGMPFSTDTTLQVVRRRSDNILVRTSSSSKYKKDITEANLGEKILDITPKEWSSRADGDDPDRRYYGLIAEEVHDLGLGNLVYYVDGEPEGVANEMVGVALIPVVKNIKDRLEALEAANG